MSPGRLSPANVVFVETDSDCLAQGRAQGSGDRNHRSSDTASLITDTELITQDEAMSYQNLKDLDRQAAITDTREMESIEEQNLLHLRIISTTVSNDDYTPIEDERQGHGKKRVNIVSRLFGDQHSGERGLEDKRGRNQKHSDGQRAYI